MDDEEQEQFNATARDLSARAIFDDEEKDLKATARIALAIAIMNLLVAIVMDLFTSIMAPAARRAWAIMGMIFQNSLTGPAWSSCNLYTDSPLRAFGNEPGMQLPFHRWDQRQR
eukprot:10712162-Heterocapsa_arctica.AAC.1